MTKTPRRHAVAPLCLAFGLLLGLPACEDDGKMTVQRINPQAGHTQGDQPIEIHGKNFRQDIGYTVYFGNQKAKQVTIRDPNLIVVHTPKGDPGAVDVTIRADDGNAFRIAQGFRYEDMGGNVVEGMGEGADGKKAKGNLAY